MSRESTVQSRRRYHLVNKLHKFALLKRIDIAIALLVLLVLSSAASSIYIFVVTGESVGLFDEPVMRPIPDDRKLTNIRSGEPLLSAIYHEPDNELFISQQGRRIHRLEPDTGIWHEEHVEGVSVEGDITLLRSGCGTHSVAQAQDCQFDEAVWGLTERGGLLRRDGVAQWKALIGDTRFIGVNGKPVEAAELSTAALSADGEWLIVGTKANGFGLFRREGRYWQPIAPQLKTSMSAVITSSKWWNGYFWLGTDNGLFRVDIDLPLKVDRVRQIRGAIYALEGSNGKQLLVLSRAPCSENATTQCQALNAFTWQAKSRSTKPAAPTALFNESRFETLSQGSVYYAEQHGDHIVVAGEAGVYRYGLIKHLWTRIDRRLVTAVTKTSGGFYYGFQGGVARILDGSRGPVEWDVADLDVIRIVINKSAVASSPPLALNVAGEVYRLGKTGKVVQVFKRSPFPIDPTTFSKGASVGDWVYLAGKAGGVVHNVRTRKNVEAPKLDNWVNFPKTPLIATDLMYAVNLSGARVNAQAFDLEKLADGKTEHLFTPDVQGPIRDLQRWGNGIAMIDAEGSAVKLLPEVEVRLTGQAAHALTAVGFNDVVQSPSGFYVATNSGTYAYDLGQRSWGDKPGPKTLQPVSKLGLVDASVWGVTNGNDLVDIDGKSILIGGGEGFGFNDRQLSDVMLAGDTLFLAGNGLVSGYSMAQRRVPEDDNYVLSGGTVKLLGHEASKPIAFAGERLWYGDKTLAGDHGSVKEAWLSSDHIWSFRRGGGERFLMAHQRSNPGNESSALCYFRQSKAHTSSGRVLDAVEISANLIAVLTTSGLYFYSEKQRRWHSSVSRQVGRADRLLKMGGMLVWVSPGVAGNGTLRHASISSIELPDSCSTETLDIDFKRELARSLTIAPIGSEIGWISPSGAVNVLSSSGKAEMYKPQNTVPEGVDLKRVFAANGDLLVTDDKSFWQYQSLRRRWSRVLLREKNQRIAGVRDIQLHQIAQDWRVTVVTNSKTLVGKWMPGDSQVDVVAVDDVPLNFERGGHALIDAVNIDSDSHWAFVFADQIKFLNPENKSWNTLQFNDSDNSRRLLSLPDGSNAVASKNGRQINLLTPGGKPWLINDYVSVELNSNQKAYLAGKNSLFRLSNDGAVKRCDAFNKRLRCETVVPAAKVVGPVTAAYSYLDQILLVGSKGWSLFDPKTSALQKIGGADLGKVPEELRAIDGKLWWRNTDGSILRLSPNLSVKKFSDQGRLVIDANNNFWLASGSGLQRYHKGKFISLVNAMNLPKDTDIHLATVAERGRIAVIDKAGHLISDAINVSNNALPDTVDVAQIKSVIAGIDDVWLWYKDDLVRIVVQDCDAGSTGDTCLALDNGIKAPDYSAALVGVTRHAKVWRFSGSNGQTYTLQENDQILVGDPSGQYEPIVGEVNDQWPQFQADFSNNLAGDFSYQPVTQLELTAGGKLFAKGKSRKQQLVSDKVVTADALAPALSTAWFSWQRKKKKFSISTKKSSVELKSEEFILDGHLAFSLPGPVIGDGVSNIIKVNRSGLWRFADSTMSLLDGPLDYVKKQLPDRIMLTHGRVIGTGVSLDYYGKDVSSTDTHRVAVGIFEIEEDLRRQGLRFIGADNRNLDRSGGGFPWDRSRSVAYYKNELLAQTPAGIVNQSLDKALALPDFPSTFLWGMQHQDLMLRQGNEWWAYKSGSWTARAGPPDFNRTLVDSAHWRWQATPARVAVTLYDNSLSFRFHQGGNGVYFSSDRVQHAAGNENVFLLRTAAWLETGTSDALLRKGQGRRLPSVSFDSLHSLRQQRVSTEVFAKRGADVLVWNVKGERFEAVPEKTNPFLHKHLAIDGRLRFEFHHGRVIKDIAIEKPGQQRSWVNFNFVEGRFPFDVVHTIASHDDRVFVGTSAGLEVHSLLNATSGIALDGVESLLDLSPGSNVQLTRITRTARPLDNKLMLQIEYPGDCRLYDAGQYTPCGKVATVFDLGAVAGLWRWELRGNKPVGHYVNRSGEYPGNVALRKGRFEHDVLRTIGNCSGRSATVWQSRPWVTVHRDTELDLKTIVDTYDFSADKPLALFCVDRAISVQGKDLARTQLSSGLYLRTQQHYFRFESNGADASDIAGNWQRVDGENVAAALSLRENRRLLQDDDHLRIRRTQDAVVFEYRPLTADWETLHWRDNTLQMDEVNGLEFVAGKLWSWTPEGFANMQQRHDGLEVDPRSLHIVRYPERKDCRVSDFSQDSESGVHTLRCDGDSEKVFAGHVDIQTDTGAWNKIANDPFVDKDMVKAADSNPLSITRIDRLGSQPGSLSFKLRGTEATLGAGRFSFDALKTLLPELSDLHIVTADGWFQVPGDSVSFSLDNYQRPIGAPLNPLDVINLTMTLHEDSVKFCMATRDKALVVNDNAGEKDGNNTVPACDRYLGADELWKYVDIEGELTMFGRDLRGRRGVRGFKEGRFGDQVVLSLPVDIQLEEDTVHLVPTLAGVVVMTREGAINGLYMPPFFGLAQAKPPPALYKDENNIVRYAAPQGLYPLIDMQASPWLISLGDAVDQSQILIEDSAPGLLTLEWKEGDKTSAQLHWLLLDLDKKLSVRQDQVLLPIEEWPEFQVNRQRWGDPPPYLDFIVRQDRLRLAAPQRQSMAIGSSVLKPLDFVLADDQVLLIEHNELWTIDVSLLIEEAFDRPRLKRVQRNN